MDTTSKLLKLIKENGSEIVKDPSNMLYHPEWEDHVPNEYEEISNMISRCIRCDSSDYIRFHVQHLELEERLRTLKICVDNIDTRVRGIINNLTEDIRDIESTISEDLAGIHTLPENDWERVFASEASSEFDQSILIIDSPYRQIKHSTLTGLKTIADNIPIFLLRTDNAESIKRHLNYLTDIPIVLIHDCDNNPTGISSYVYSADSDLEDIRKVVLRMKRYSPYSKLNFLMTYISRQIFYEGFETEFLSKHKSGVWLIIDTEDDEAETIANSIFTFRRRIPVYALKKDESIEMVERYSLKYNGPMMMLLADDGTTPMVINSSAPIDMLVDKFIKFKLN